MPSTPTGWSRIFDAFIVAAIICAASLFGILTRPLDFLAAFWPANAILLGMMVRWPRLATPLGWIAAIVGYFLADLLTGGTWLATAWLTAGNVAGALTGWLLFRRHSAKDLHLQNPLSVLRLLTVCAIAAFAAAAVGSGTAPILFDKSWAEGFWFWFATELVNSIVILPVLFTFPRYLKERQRRFHFRKEDIGWRSTAPFIALLASIAATELIGGPGAIAIPITALLWCALSYGLFTSAVLTMLLCMWLLIAISAGFLPIPLEDDFMQSMTSLRLGITLLALGPLTVASINRAKTELLRKLHYSATHDDLTRSFSRKAFFDRGEDLLMESKSSKTPLSVLMVDVDDFKQLNDQYGHALGDSVLVGLVGAFSELLREEDIFGRIGGEEFAVLLPGMSIDEAAKTAGRFQKEAKTISVSPAGGSVARVTVSIGVAMTDVEKNESLEEVLARADNALYEAKENGKDQVICS